MAARNSTPVIGALCSRSGHSADPPKRQLWTVNVGYRYQPSSRHYIGTVEQKQRELTNNQIQNIYHLFDVSVERRLTNRFTLTSSLPILFAYRNQLYAPTAKYRVDSIGDMTVGGRMWIFRPPTENGGNIGVGLNLKLPTGKYNATGVAKDRNGNTIIATADQSIQAGDGRTGFSVDIQGYHPMPLQTMFYFSGAYLFNPADTNGVSTFRTKKGEEVFSVADQYIGRAGFSHAMPKIRNVTLTFGGRIEGVPVRDLLGKSNGFRRPGYAISADPGFMYQYRGHLFSVNVPWAIERNRRRSVADIQYGGHGDAAFADYTLVLGYSRRF